MINGQPMHVFTSRNVDGNADHNLNAVLWTLTLHVHTFPARQWRLTKLNTCSSASAIDTVLSLHLSVNPLSPCVFCMLAHMNLDAGSFALLYVLLHMHESLQSILTSRAMRTGVTEKSALHSIHSYWRGHRPSGGCAGLAPAQHVCIPIGHGHHADIRYKRSTSCLPRIAR